MGDRDDVPLKVDATRCPWRTCRPLPPPASGGAGGRVPMFSFGLIHPDHSIPHPAPQEPGAAVAQRRPAVAALPAPVAGGADERVAVLLPGAGGSLVPLLLHVRRSGVWRLHSHGQPKVLKRSPGLHTFGTG